MAHISGVVLVGAPLVLLLATLLLPNEMIWPELVALRPMKLLLMSLSPM